MANDIVLTSGTKKLNGTIRLTGSKSIANRVLLIRALCEEPFEIYNMSESDDSQTMMALLKSNDYELDVHHAGTTFRFLTAYLAVNQGENILTGSARMKQRPIGPLVDALRDLGCQIEYLENENYPPLKIGTPGGKLKSEVTVRGDISSQYLSALLMVGPCLPEGLVLAISGDLVSRPYLEMTLSTMAYFGVEHHWEGNVITVPPQKYKARDYFVEADWSAASYYYSLAAIAEEADLILEGLKEDSLQGDAAMAKIGEAFGVETTYLENKIRLVKPATAKAPGFFEYDFIKQPDIAQTVFAMCAATDTKGLFTGLQTLYIKETDRLAAFKTELLKVGSYLSKVPEKFKQNTAGEYFMLEGQAQWEMRPVFDTYHDHRMAMALAPLALLGPIEVRDSDVVSKSYPAFWEDLISLGFEVKHVDNEE